MKSLRKLLALVFVLVVGASAAGPASASDYPAQPVTVIVAFTPGGTTDMLTRMVSTRLTEKLGKTFVVENKPGAGGNIGTEFVVKAKPDGYTLMVNSVGPIAVNPTLYKNLPYNPITDLEPVVQIADVPNVLVVPAGANTPSLKALIEKGKAKKGGLSYCSTGVGTSSHLSGFMFAQASNVDGGPHPLQGRRRAERPPRRAQRLHVRHHSIGDAAHPVGQAPADRGQQRSSAPGRCLTPRP